MEVFNARGSIRLRAQVGGSVPQCVVAARLNWNKLSGADGAAANNVNALTSETVTDIGAGATFYSTLVEVRKVRVRPGVETSVGRRPVTAG